MLTGPHRRTAWYGRRWRHIETKPHECSAWHVWDVGELVSSGSPPGGLFFDVTWGIQGQGYEILCPPEHSSRPCHGSQPLTGTQDASAIWVGPAPEDVPTTMSGNKNELGHRSKWVAPVNWACRYMLFSLHSNDTNTFKTRDFTGKFEFLASEIWKLHLYGATSAWETSAHFNSPCSL